MKRLLTLVAFFATVHASAQQVNPVPDYVFANRMSAGRNTVTDTAAYFSIGPRYGATRGMMPPMVVDTASFSGNKRNGLLIFSVQKNKFLYWDSVGVKWAEMAGTGGSAITGSGVAGYMPEFTTTTNLDTTKLYHSAGRFTIGSTTTTNGVFNVYGGQSYFDTSILIGTNTLFVNESNGRIGIGNVSPLAPLHVGNRLVNNSVDPVILISRNVNDSSGSGNAHAFTDGSNVYRSGGMSYNSFDARINITGSNNMGHYAAFQAAPEYNNSGTMDEYFGFFSYIGTNAGTITHNYNNYVANPSGAGSVTNNYGLYVAAQTKGTNNYAVHLNNADATGRYNLYVNGTAYNFLNGRTGIGTSSPATMLDVVGTGQFSGELRLNSTGSQIKFGGQGTGTQTGIFQGSNSSILYISDYATGTKGIRIDASNGEVHISNSTDLGDYKLQVNGNAIIDGNLRTSAPTGGTANDWRLGTVATVSPTSPNRTIEVSIGGTIYYIAAKTTND